LTPLQILPLEHLLRGNHQFSGGSLPAPQRIRCKTSAESTSAESTSKLSQRLD
jgi:hypothetical protein